MVYSYQASSYLVTVYGACSFEYGTPPVKHSELAPLFEIIVQYYSNNNGRTTIYQNFE